LGGLDGALINAFAADHNLKVQLFATDFTSSLLALTQHKADMGAYFYWSTTRAQQAFYTLPIFADSTVVIYKDTFNYTGPASLQGKRLGATVGSVYTPLVQKFFGTSHVTVYPGITQMSTALINGQVDALVEANTVATEPPLAGRSDIKLTPVNAGEFGIPAAQLTNPAYNIVPCGSTKLADALDAELLKLQQSGAWATALTANSAQAINVPSGRPAQGC
jgi:polar amino acid transport system substrate-binding protein